MSRKFSVDLLINAKDNASKAVQGLTQRIGGLGKAVAGVGAAIGSYFSGRAIVGFFKGAVDEASALEKALSRVSAVTRAVPADMARLKAAAEEMGASTKFTANEAASAMEALGRAGLGVDETLQAIPSVLALASGQSLELGESAKIVASAVKGMQLSFEDAGRVADVLALAASSANTDVQGLSTALSYAAPNAVAAGLEIEELAAYIGTLANAGYDGSRAGTALSRMMAEFVNPASGMRKALAGVGITTNDFTEAMTQLQAKGDDALPVIVALGQRAGPALRTLLGQGIDGVKGLTDKLNDAEGAAKAASTRMQDNLAGAIVALKSAWSALKITLVDPLLEPLAEQVRRLTERIRKAATDGSLDQLRERLVEAFGSAVEAAEEFARELGGVDGALQKLDAAVLRTLDFFQRLSAAGQLAGNTIKAAFFGIQAALAATLTPISALLTVVMAGVNAVTQGLAKLGQVSQLTAYKVEAIYRGMQESTFELGRLVVSSLGDTGQAISGAAVAFSDLTQEITRAEGAARQTAAAADETNQSIFRSADAFDAWAEATQNAASAQTDMAAALQEIDRRIAAQRDAHVEATTASTDAMAALRAEVQAAADQYGALRAAGAQQDEIAAAAMRLQAAQESLAIRIRQAREEQRQLAQESRRASGELDAATGSAAALDDEMEDLDDSLEDASQSLDGVAAGSRRSAAEMAELRRRIEDARSRLLELVRAGADMAVIAAASNDLMLAQRDLADALTDTGEQAAATQSQLEQLVGAIAAVEVAADSATQVAGWDALAQASYDVRRAWIEGRLTAEEYAQALESLRTKQAELAASGDQLAASNRDVAQSFRGIGEAAQAGASRLEDATTRKQSAVTSMFQAVRRAYGDLSEGMREFYDSQIRRIRTLRDWYDRFNDVEFERHRAAFQKLADDADRLEASLRAGTFSALDLAQATRLLSSDTAAARSGVIALGDERLIPLREAIESARRRMTDLGEDAQGTLAGLREELLRLRGDEEELERLRTERRKAELAAQLAAARAQGNQGAVAAYSEALRVLEQIGAEEARQRVERRQEEASARRVPEPERAQPAAPVVPMLQPVRTVTVQLGSARADIPESQADAFLRELERAAQVGGSR